MGSTPSKELPARRASLKTPRSQQQNDLRRKNKAGIIYRDKSLSQVPTTLTNALIENVFLISAGSAVGDELPESCVYVGETAKMSGLPLLTQNNMDQAVFERMLSPNPSHVTVKFNGISRCTSLEIGSCGEKGVLKYLYQCFMRWKILSKDDKYAAVVDDVIHSKNVIFQNAKICMKQTDLFPGQQTHKQFIDICIDNRDKLLEKESTVYDFLMELFAILESERGCMMECLVPVLKCIKRKFQTEFKLTKPEEIRQHVLVLRVFTLRPSLAEIFMNFNTPADWSKAACFEDTLIGSVLSMNTCPKTGNGPYAFFCDAIDLSWQEIGQTLQFIWQCVTEICDDLYRVLMGCIRLSADLRHLVINWFGKCLDANRGKPDLWSAHEVEVFDTPFCSDGFCLNLCQVLLHMCQSFSEPSSQLMLQVKPSYCRASPKTDDERKTLCVHARGLDNEVPFVPYTEDSELSQCDSYHYISDCFFLTHQALHIGYSIVFKLIKLNGSVNRMEKLYSDIKDVYPGHIVDPVRHQLSRETCWYLNIKAALAQQQLTMRCLYFHIATASWLVQVASSDDVTKFKPVSLPLNGNVPKSLSCLPQYIITNLAQFLVPVNLFQGQELLTNNEEVLQHFITLILVFMGSPGRLVNVNVRAQLAETLETILPALNEDGTWASSKSGNTEKALNEHPLIEHLAETILNVFVSTETSGPDMEDEKKLSNRKSMHKVIQYIWQIPRHKQAFKRQSKRAVANISSTDPPLFLRFINLLINDANFLLDEALDYMRQIHELEIERDSGKWFDLSVEEFQDRESVLQGLAIVGLNRNVMANHTIYTFELLTKEIKKIFCHHVMVDRIAGMLNYFLEHLVGKKQCDYIVRDRSMYAFKPEQLVSDISHIYVSLGHDDQFCKAVIGESRSFSENLFPQAMTVLEKIGVSPDFIDQFRGLSEKLQTMEVAHKQEEEMMADAPEEFLDPIMGTLMVDPVKLPTSNTNIDRSVIARHLLSDQRDPFTNLPLSMEMVAANRELQKKIRIWKKNNIERSERT